MLTIGISGLADGNEKLTVDFAADANFDGNGNAADASQSNNVLTLRENTSYDRFDDPIGRQRKSGGHHKRSGISSVNGSGALQTSDFPRTFWRYSNPTIQPQPRSPSMEISIP